MNKKQWSYSYCGEQYYGEFDSREEAIEAVREEGRDVEEVYIGVCGYYEEECRNIAEGVIDKLRQDACDVVEDYAEDYMNLTAEHEIILEERLKAVILAFQKEFNYEPRFAVVKEAELVSLVEEEENNE